MDILKKTPIKIALLAITFLACIALGFYLGLASDNQELFSATQRRGTTEYFRAFEKISHVHNLINENIFNTYMHRDWQEEFTPHWQTANKHEDISNEEISAALEGMVDYIGEKRDMLGQLYNLIYAEEQLIEELAETADNLPVKELVIEKTDIMHQTNSKAYKTAMAIDYFLDSYEEFINKREALLREKVTSEEFNEFMEANNKEREEYNKQIEGYINDILIQDLEVKEIYEEIMAQVTQ